MTGLAIASKYDDNVFLNVPFDRAYLRLLRALIFAIHDCGFQSRCALENSDGGIVRVEKLYTIISECRYGIHDISRTSLDSKSKLPRFNMPLELGMFLGAKRYGDSIHKQKNCLVLDKHKYRYQKFCSDLAGQDIRSHENKAGTAVAAVRDWLSDARHGGDVMPGGKAITERYEEFRRELPSLCRVSAVRPDELTFLNFRTLVIGWLVENPL